MVERGPEKAGVGGSIPSLATIQINNLAEAKELRFSSSEQYPNIDQPTFVFSELSCSISFQISRAVLPVFAKCFRASFA